MISENFPVSITPEVEDILPSAAVAIGVSGGKDSQATALRMAEYLDHAGHSGPRILIHSDLGRVEWRDSLPVCERLSKRLGWDLVVVRRNAGDMMDRWETRWRNNVERYSNLSCVKIILPWSTPSMRFCTSELKTNLICAELVRRFRGQPILSVTGIRHEESSSRARMPIAHLQPKLVRKGSPPGFNWNPIIDWSTSDVFSYLREKEEPLHEAYSSYESSRVSCTFCIMGSFDDLKAAARCDDNAEIYRTMVDLEIRSTFALQGSRWLGDVAPHLLSVEMRDALDRAKALVKVRQEAEATIPDRLLFVSGVPTSVPTMREAILLSEVRKTVSNALGIDVGYLEPRLIIKRYTELMKDPVNLLTTTQMRVQFIPNLVFSE